MGTRFLENSAENHLIEKLSYGASILGLTVIGAMIGTMVTLQLSLIHISGFKEAEWKEKLL